MRKTLLAVGLIIGLLCGCGGGGSENEAEPLALLQGSWFGPAVDGSLRLVLDSVGGITQVEEDGLDTGLTGTVQHVTGSYYEGLLSNGRLVRLFVDPSRAYAAFFGELRIACLERGASELPPLGFRVDDIAPDFYAGTNLVLDDDLKLSEAHAASVEIDADGRYAGTDASGLEFESPIGTMLAPFLGVLEGPYEDNANPTTGFMEVLPSPDMQFLVAVAFPVTNTTLLNGQFIGAWNRD